MFGMGKFSEIVVERTVVGERGRGVPTTIIAHFSLPGILPSPLSSVFPISLGALDDCKACRLFVLFLSPSSFDSGNNIWNDMTKVQPDSP